MPIPEPHGADRCGAPKTPTATWLTDVLRRAQGHRRPARGRGGVGAGGHGADGRQRAAAPHLRRPRPPGARPRWWASSRPPTTRAGPRPWRCGPRRSRCASTRRWPTRSGSAPPAATSRTWTPSSAEFALVLQDMAPARQGDQMAGCTVDEASLALAELARLHAPRWGDPALERPAVAGAPDAGGDGGGELLPHPVRRIRRALRSRPRRRRRGCRPPPVPPHPRATCDHARDRAPCSTPTTDSTTCCSGPTPAGPDGDRRRLADRDPRSGARGRVVLPRGRARARAAPGPRGRTLLHDYHQRLVADGVGGYSWDDCLTEYRRHAYAGYVMAVGASMLVERTERGDEMFLTMARRHAAQVLDLDSEALLSAD